MIGHLKGKTLARTPGELLIDVRGVGYKVHIPLSTYYEIEKKSADAELSLFIHTHVREDALALFGFATERERQLFEHLISVSGIGPKLAQTILSGMQPDDLLTALAAGDRKRLYGIPGVGKKTAERMIIDLADKVRGLAAEASTIRKVPAPDEDLVGALVGLGYRVNVVEKAVSRVAHEYPDLELAERLKACLKILSR